MDAVEQKGPKRGRWRGLLMLAAGLATGAGVARAETILFVGNSFTFGALSPVWRYRGGEVTDLNAEGVGGVPALFKLFTRESGLDYEVSLETSPGKDLQWHIDHKLAVIDKAWDHVVLQTYSTLDSAHPGNPASLIAAAAVLAGRFHDRNPKADVRLTATWSRADMTYHGPGPWFGTSIEAMARDLRTGTDKAAGPSSGVAAVIPVGEAWNRAMATGLADANPYDGLDAGKLDLWAYDNYHASAFGYYLEALMVFGSVTGRDPASLGPSETAAAELGFAPAQTTALQKIAHDQLAAEARPTTR